jgi:hypothetical protein
MYWYTDSDGKNIWGLSRLIPEMISIFSVADAALRSPLVPPRSPRSCPSPQLSFTSPGHCAQSSSACARQDAQQATVSLRHCAQNSTTCARQGTQPVTASPRQCAQHTAESPRNCAQNHLQLSVPSPRRATSPGVPVQHQEYFNKYTRTLFKCMLFKFYSRRVACTVSFLICLSKSAVFDQVDASCNVVRLSKGFSAS